MYNGMAHGFEAKGMATNTALQSSYQALDYAVSQTGRYIIIHGCVPVPGPHVSYLCSVCIAGKRGAGKESRFK